MAVLCLAGIMQAYCTTKQCVDMHGERDAKCTTLFQLNASPSAHLKTATPPLVASLS
jgi:hypothetical protein